MIKTTKIETSGQLNDMPDGLYEVISDPCNIYIVKHNVWYMLSKAHCDIIVSNTEFKHTMPIQELIELRKGGYTVSDIAMLKREGLV